MTYLQDDLENASELFFLVDNFVIELQLNVKTQVGAYILKYFFQGAEIGISFNVPAKDPSILKLPKQWSPNLESM